LPLIVVDAVVLLLFLPAHPYAPQICKIKNRKSNRGLTSLVARTAGNDGDLAGLYHHLFGQLPLYRDHY
jgi:hypothetical protein